MCSFWRFWLTQVSFALLAQLGERHAAPCLVQRSIVWKAARNAHRSSIACVLARLRFCPTRGADQARPCLSLRRVCHCDKPNDKHVLLFSPLVTLWPRCLRYQILQQAGLLDDATPLTGCSQRLTPGCTTRLLSLVRGKVVLPREQQERVSGLAAFADRRLVHVLEQIDELSHRSQH